LFPHSVQCSIVALAVGLAVAPVPNASNLNNGPVVRVALQRELAGRSEITLFAPGGLNLSDGTREAEIEGPVECRITSNGGMLKITLPKTTPAGWGAIRAESPSDGQPLEVRAAGGITRRFRGSLRFSVERSSISILNAVTVEDYLRGVVPLEMGADAPADALRAQAVAARTYALKSRARSRDRAYDVTDTPMSQVYGGVNAEKLPTDAAVHETAGLVLTRGGELVSAEFNEDCGGVTAPGETDGGFPPAVLDGPDERTDFCASGRNHSWSLSLTATELARALNAADRKRVGEIVGLEIVRRDVSGRATTVLIRGVGGSAEVKAVALRSAVGYDRLRSTLFKVAGESGNLQDGAIVVEGRGSGHGHGLCQSGALAMASASHRKSYREILAHYFPGSIIAPFSE
jgi:stage II sporulation protein D